MLKLLNPYSILAALAVAGLLFIAGYWKGKVDGENAALRKALTSSQRQVKIANQGAKTLTDIANEKDDSTTGSSADVWMQSPVPWK